MGHQLLYWHYLRSINHPLLALLDESPQSFVGEDVELSLMLLSNYSSTTNLSRDTKDASDAYKKLGVLSHIAKKVRDYKVSRFGGSSPSRARVTYDNSSPEVLAATHFVRKFIDKAEERGVLTYKLQMNNKPIPKRIHARKHAKIYINVPQLDLSWQPFAKKMLQRHLEALNDKAQKVSATFDRRFLEQFADLYSFDDAALARFENDAVDSDSSIDDLPLSGSEWQQKMEARIPVDYSEAAIAEAKARKEKLRSERKGARENRNQVPSAGKRPGRPRKKPLPVALAPISAQPALVPAAVPPVAPASVPPKRRRGRPPGSRNKKTLLRLSQPDAKSLPNPASTKKKIIPESVRDAAADVGDRFVFSLSSSRLLVVAIWTSSIQSDSQSPLAKHQSG